MNETKTRAISARTDPGHSSLPIQDHVLHHQFGVNGKVIELVIVADGMGGYSDGARVSQMVIETVCESVRELLSNGRTPSNALDEAIQQANQVVCQYAQTQDIRTGSTITCALLCCDKATIANVGDSRTYLYRQQQLQQITRDHSFVEELIQRGLMPPEERYDSRYVNVMTRAIGTAEEVAIDIFELPLFPDDMLLLCSDGLWGMLRDPEIAAYLDSPESLEQIGRQLIQAANEAGGKDHISVVLVR
jgi:serine/threonine protein phosphatase PrpC